jgi:hypothetical protein
VFAGRSVQLASAQPDPGQVRQATRDILGRPEFRPPGRSLIQALIHWLGTQVSNLLNGLMGIGGGGTVGAVIVVTVIVALLGGVVWLVFRHWVRVPADRQGPVVVTTGRLGRPAADWLAEAAAHEAAGKWRLALRARYRALVAELAGRGIVREIAGRTSGEYRREVDVAVPTGAASFDGATDLFEQTWYGDRPAGPEDQARFAALSERVLNEAR